MNFSNAVLLNNKKVLKLFNTFLVITTHLFFEDLDLDLYYVNITLD